MTADIRSYTPGAGVVDPYSAGYFTGVGGGILWGSAFGGAVSARIAKIAISTEVGVEAGGGAEVGGRLIHEPEFAPVDKLLIKLLRVSDT
jgi:hypothetical protein